MIEKVGVIGAGHMGSGIATVCAQSGCSVILVDIGQSELEKSQTFIEKSLGMLNELSTAQREEIRARISMGDTYALFQHRASLLLNNHHYVVAVEALRQIRDAQRSATEREMSAEAGQSIQFGHWQQGQNHTSLAPAEDYLVVRWAQTQSDSLVADSTVGLVATSVPYWRHALKLALDEEKITATPISDVQRSGVYLDALENFRPVSLYAVKFLLGCG